MRHPNGMDALLAAIVAAALLPGSLMAVIVSTAHRQLGFTLHQAAALGTADMAGVAAGSLLVALVAQPRSGQRALTLLLGLSCLADLASAMQGDWPALLALRTARGVLGGLIVGIGYGAIGRRVQPDRVFGQVLLLQFLLGGLGTILLPPLLRTTGAPLLFVLLAAIGGGLALCCLAAGRGDPGLADDVVTVRRLHLPVGRQAAALAALFLAEAGHTAGSAFVLEWGRQVGHGIRFTEQVAGIAGISGALGAVAAIAAGGRWGRMRPILLATFASLMACALILTPARAAFTLGLFAGSIAWAWSVPYMLGWCTARGDDRSGGAWAGVAAKLGLASGPALGAAGLSLAGPPGPFWIAGTLAAVSGALFWAGRERLVAAAR